MQSSGTTAIATSGDGAVTLIAATTAEVIRAVTILNDGAVDGFFCLDGSTWCRLPANSRTTIEPCYIVNTAIQVKRVAGGSDLSNVWGYAWNNDDRHIHD